VCKGIFSLREKATFELICRRCENASCVVACPFEAIEKTHDGIIKRHNMRCVSCKSCAIACPFGTIYAEMLPFYEVNCDDCLSTASERSTPSRRSGFIREDLDLEFDPPPCVPACPHNALEYRAVDPAEPGVHIVDEFLAARARKWVKAESSREGAA
jgi:Fe-S-cluster-containing hydrogenase component 2